MRLVAIYYDRRTGEWKSPRRVFPELRRYGVWFGWRLVTLDAAREDYGIRFPSQLIRETP